MPIAAVALHEERRLYLRAERWPALSSSRPAIFRCCSLIAPYVYLVAVGASPGTRAVVLHRAIPAGFRTRRCRNGVAHGERERESQSNLAQHDQSPHVEARSDFYGLDRRAPRLFPGPHSNGVRSA